MALVGGGTFPQPGEIPLEHNGVLFLNELPEFKRTVPEVMRQPPEDRVITISRVKSTVAGKLVNDITTITGSIYGADGCKGQHLFVG